MIKPMPLDAQRYVEAAEGWLALGDWRSANEELENIEAPLRAHPDVLKMRVEIFSAAKRWDYVIAIASTFARQLPDHPFGHVRLAFALHELKRTKEAWEILLPVAEKFPDQWIVPYNLACYAAQLGDLVGARDWLAQAFTVGDSQALKLASLEDPDLAPLWHGRESA